MKKVYSVKRGTLGSVEEWIVFATSIADAISLATSRFDEEEVKRGMPSNPVRAEGSIKSVTEMYVHPLGSDK